MNNIVTQLYFRKQKEKGWGRPLCEVSLVNEQMEKAVRVTDDDNSTDIATLPVIVSDLAPSAAFDWSPEPQDEGLAVTFTD